MRSLHITNGDVLPWRDPMHHGPFPKGVGFHDLSQLRAQYLAGPDADPTKAERDLRLRDAHLAASTSYDSIVLWFGHGWACFCSPERQVSRS